LIVIPLLHRPCFSPFLIALPGETPIFITKSPLFFSVFPCPGINSPLLANDLPSSYVRCGFVGLWRFLGIEAACFCSKELGGFPILKPSSIGVTDSPLLSRQEVVDLLCPRDLAPRTSFFSPRTLTSFLEPAKKPVPPLLIEFFGISHLPGGSVQLSNRRLYVFFVPFSLFPTLRL